MDDAKYKLGGRLWIEDAKGKLLGPGRAELLERIAASGSIRQAALQMKMSYKQAWDIVNYLNEHLSGPVVISHRGGKGGGNAVVTEYGRAVANEFRLFQQKFREFLAENSGLINL
ncbi:MAG: ModE family transcriptional regulator [Bacteroidota bacterium]